MAIFFGIFSGMQCQSHIAVFRLKRLLNFIRKIQMKKLSAIIIAASAVFAGTAAFASGQGLARENPYSENVGLPYGNFGLNALSDKIVEGQNLIDENVGLHFFFDYYAVLLTNPYGGAEQATNYTHEMIYGVRGDLEKLVGWKNATFVVSGAYNAGGNLSNTIGNFFTASESSVTDGALLYEIYLAQKISTSIGDFKVRLGRISMADTFASLPVFGYLVSGGIDCTPEAIFSNSPYTSSPIATWGVTIQYSPDDQWSFAYGLYQVPQNVQSPNYSGTNLKISGDDAYMMMAQVTWTPSFIKDCDGNVLPGTYQFGGYFFGGFPMQQYGTNDTRENGYGFYLQGQQTVWIARDNPNQYVSIWAGAQFSPVESISIMPWMVYSGLQFQGFVPYRDQDGVYVSWLWGNFGSDYSRSSGYDASYETVVEVTYVFQLTPNISIQPDLQYIMRPYGNDDIDDALVIGGQLLVTF